MRTWQITKDGKVVDHIEAEEMVLTDGLVVFWTTGNIVAVTALGQGSVLRPVDIKPFQ